VPDRLRILNVSGTTVGGSGRSQRELAARLVERGHVAEFVVDDEAPARTVRWWYGHLSDLSVRLQARPGGRLIRHLERRPGRRAQTKRIGGLPHHVTPIPENAVESILERLRPDVVVGSSVLRLTWRRVLEQCRARGIPTVLYIREVEALNHFDGGASPADLVVANAESLVEQLATLGIRSSFVPSVTEVDVTKVDSSREVALLVNPIESRGLEMALAAARELPHIPFVLQESWPLTADDWRRLTDEVASMANVEVRRVEEPGPQLYRDARVVLVPYRVSNRPRVILEAHANGIPVIAADVPALAEAIGPGGVVVPLDDIDQWVAAVGAMWDDDDRYAALCAAAVAHSRRPEVDPVAVAAQFEALLLEVCGTS
jgi:glycosyltransferase involved in cell wall biosynthesis